MDTAFIIGNGESRNIFPIKDLKGKGIIYGCNAIYRDYPNLCDYIISVNPLMYEELKKWYNKTKPNLKLIGPDDISKWNYVLPNDKEYAVPKGLKLYRIWRGGDLKKYNYKTNTPYIKTIDFSESKGTGCSAVLHAAELGIKNIIIMAFDIIGAQQWAPEMTGEVSRIQNNIYKSTKNYPYRVSMKAYLKYEWLYQLRQTFLKFPNTNFYYINRLEYLRLNPYLRHYFDVFGHQYQRHENTESNIKCGIYADLRRWIEGERDKIKWTRL